MGGVLEFIAAFVLIVYVGGKLVSEGISNADYKRKQEQREQRKKAFEDKVINVEFEKEYAHLVREDESYRREVEKECLEVFAELPSWRWLKSWRPTGYSLYNAQWAPPIPESRKKEREEARQSISCIHSYVAEIIYFANRGYVDRSYRFIEDDIASVECRARGKDIDLFNQMQKELMIWWRDKLHSFGVKADLLCWYEEYDSKKNSFKKIFHKIEDVPDDQPRRRYMWDAVMFMDDYNSYRLQEHS